MRLVTKFFSDQDQFDTSFDGTSSGNNSMAADASFRKAVMAASGQCAGDLCKMDRFVEDSVDGTLGYNIYPPSKCKVTETGLLTTARTSTAEKGALLANDITEAYVTIISNRFD